MLTFMCTCIMKLMLGHVRVGGGVGGVMPSFFISSVKEQVSFIPTRPPLHTYTRVFAVT